MSIKNLKRTNEVEVPKDYIGGGLLESGVYNAIVKMAYLGKSQAGAQFVNLEFDIDGRSHRETIYITNRNGDITYESGGKKHYLPGFVTADELCAMTTGTALADQDEEEKLVEIYDYETKSNIPTQVPVLINLIGKQCKLAIQHVLDYKTKKNESTGKYEPIDETFESNAIVKVFDTDGLTYNEKMAQIGEPDFIHKWKEKNEGVTYDKTKKKNPTKSNTGSKPNAQPAKSLFGND